MFQAFKKEFHKQVAAILPDQKYYTSPHLSEVQMPIDVGHFLSQALSRRTELEARDLISCSSPWIDFDSESAQRTVNDFVTQLGQQGRFPKNELQKALVRAVDYCSQYLFQPVAAITAFAVTDRERIRSSIDIRRRAGYFVYHTSVLQSLENYLNQMDGVQFTLADIESHLRKEAVEEARDLDAEGWLRLIDPIMKTVRIVYPESERVPVQLIQLFLEERAADGLSTALASAAELSGGHLSADDMEREIRTFFEPALTESPPSEPVSTEDTELPLWKQFAKNERGVSNNHSDIPSHETKAQPLWKTYQQESVASETSIQPQTQPQIQPQTRTSTRSEETILGDAIRYRGRFIEELFESDPVAFESAIDRLSGVQSWEEASQILTQEVFRKYRIDIYGETAILFTNAIEKQVKQRS
ncbi:MAG: hypothetical protein E2O85_05020 [Bacteroidetes bacterium]|nr:MAG: hypothetical protein E2O85_05020 [Bacteroidota bacterium]